MSVPWKWIIILTVSFLPALIYSVYIRNIEKWKREPWSYVLIGYIWGALAAGLFIAFTYYGYGQIEREHEYFQFFRSNIDILIIVALFPIIGEALKSVGLLLVKKELDEIEDGLIHGAITGLAFGSFANVAYLFSAFTWETEAVAGYQVPTLAFLGMASISTILLHGSSTAAAGYGISTAILKKDYFHMALYFLAGVVIHILFNLLSITTIYFELQSGLYNLIGLAGIMLISMIVFRTIRARLLKLIEILDYETHMKNRY